MTEAQSGAARSWCAKSKGAINELQQTRNTKHQRQKKSKKKKKNNDDSSSSSFHILSLFKSPWAPVKNNPTKHGKSHGWHRRWPDLSAHHQLGMASQVHMWSPTGSSGILTETRPLLLLQRDEFLNGFVSMDFFMDLLRESFMDVFCINLFKWFMNWFQMNCRWTFMILYRLCWCCLIGFSSGLFNLYRFCGFELTCFRNLQVLADVSMVFSSGFCRICVY